MTTLTTTNLNPLPFQDLEPHRFVAIAAGLQRRQQAVLGEADVDADLGTISQAAVDPVQQFENEVGATVRGLDLARAQLRDEHLTRASEDGHYHVVLAAPAMAIDGAAGLVTVPFPEKQFDLDDQRPLEIVAQRVGVSVVIDGVALGVAEHGRAKQLRHGVHSEDRAPRVPLTRHHPLDDPKPLASLAQQRSWFGRETVATRLEIIRTR